MAYIPVPNQIFSEPKTKTMLTFNHQNRADGRADNFFGDAAHEEPGKTGPPVRAHDNDLGANIFGRLHNQARGFAGFYNRCR